MIINCTFPFSLNYIFYTYWRNYAYLKKKFINVISWLIDSINWTNNQVLNAINDCN